MSKNELLPYRIPEHQNENPPFPGPEWDQHTPFPRAEPADPNGPNTSPHNHPGWVGGGDMGPPGSGGGVFLLVFGITVACEITVQPMNLNELGHGSYRTL